MTEQNRSLLPDDVELLKLLRDAATTPEPFEYRPLGRWRFGWLIHDGLSDGLCVVDSESFDRLHDAGFVRITHEDPRVPTCKVEITEDGRNYRLPE